MTNARFRPPSEANSLILQVDQGCPYNRCTFCGMYRDIPYERLSVEQAEELVVQASRRHADAQRIFLADGDVMRRPFTELQQILTAINAHYPHLARVSLYANGSSIADKTEDQLRTLRSLKLHTLYMGMESGDEEVLKACRKGENAPQMVDAGIKAEAAGLRMSVMILLGLGGAALSKAHAANSAAALNRMQPRFLSTLRVVPVPGTELYEDTMAGRFTPLTEYEIVEELYNLISALDLNSTVFRANHSSNVVPIKARFPRDKTQALSTLQTLLASDTLDKHSPGHLPMWL
ncbi:MAG: radical SAM protein [Kiritimatiellia bacterium]|jgi:radical SAM superfamily enzyme YgiQ (UPF0313 family)|nr:radical SAM protein [Kiritimatiellia bacterium]MDP6848779.1 radical SAM protein [Kiritimatiellia bacterium]